MEKRSIWQRIKTPPQLPAKWSWAVTLGLLLFAAVGLTCLCLLIGTLNFQWDRFSAFWDDPLLLMLNFTPIFLCLFLCYISDNKAWVAYLTTGVIFILLSFINYYKVVLRGEPFTFSDFTLVKEGAGIAGEYEFPLPIWLFVSIALLVVGSLVLARYARARIPRKLYWLRLILVVLIIALGVGAWCGWYRDTERYDGMLFVNDGPFNVWKDAENYASKGFVYSFLHSIAEAFPPAPEGYSQEKAAEILGQYDNIAIPENQKVNVVVTMLESFSDLSMFDSVPFTADPYEAWHALEKESYTGLLISDTVGGGTNNAERSFLTGFTYPHPSYRGMTNSYVHLFRAMDYQTDGGHPGYEWFYDRKEVNRRLGFDRYLLTENFWYEESGVDHAMDEVFFTALRRIYEEETADGEPYFSFSVSYQNHSPYNTTSLDGGEFVSGKNLNDEAYYLINNYLNGLKDTGEQVSAYVDQFRNDKEPVVLLFFGDHKATLGNANCYYEDMGMNAQVYTPAGCWDIYTTPYLIWANDAAKAILGDNFHGTGDTISPAFLMAELFEVCGWEGNSWMQYQREVAKTLPVFHCDFMFMENGKLTRELSEAGQAVYDEFQIVQYYLREEYVRYMHS